MTLRLGYLLPTREAVMAGEPAAAPLLELAERAESLGLDSLWVGDSLLARPRHDPLTLLAAVAARTRRCEIGTAVLLPALRNPVLLAHQVATIDQIAEGRLILGVGIARDIPSIRAEFAAAGVPFESRVGRMLEGLRLCRALWSGAAVEWQGRWPVANGILGPTPHRAGGPPIWLAGSLPASLERIAREFDGWMPNDGDAAEWGQRWADLKARTKAAGRDSSALTGAIYLTVSVDENAERGNARLDAYLEQYYGAPAAVLRRRQVCYAGAAAGLMEWLQGYVDAGARHLIVRGAGEHERHLGILAAARENLCQT